MAEITALTEVQQMNLDILRLVQSDTAAAERQSPSLRVAS